MGDLLGVFMFGCPNGLYKQFWSSLHLASKIENLFFNHLWKSGSYSRVVRGTTTDFMEVALFTQSKVEGGEELKISE